jgi:membrane-associated phospholipid phosphatase
MIQNIPFARKIAPTGVFFVVAALILVTGSNQSLFLSLNHLSQTLPPGVWANLTFLADGAAGIALMSVLLRNHAKMVFWAIWGAIITSTVVNLSKHGFGVARPPAVLDPELFLNIGAALKAGSFPSGHTTSAFYVAALIASARDSKMWVAACLVGALLLGFSRIAVGVHWPMDVMAGAGLGWFLGSVVTSYAHKAPDLAFWQKLFTISICLTGSLYLFIFDPKLPYVTILQYSLASLGTGICVRAFILEAVLVLQKKAKSS